MEQEKWEENGRKVIHRKEVMEKKRNTVSHNDCEILKAHWLFEVC